MNGKYAGDNDRVEEALQRWVSKQFAAAEFRSLRALLRRRR
jgi:hypothetical protein